MLALCRIGVTVGWLFLITAAKHHLYECLEKDGLGIYRDYCPNLPGTVCGTLNASYCGFIPQWAALCQCG
jgi:hypothetical protein